MHKNRFQLKFNNNTLSTDDVFIVDPKLKVLTKYGLSVFNHLYIHEYNINKHWLLYSKARYFETASVRNLSIPTLDNKT